MMTTSSADKVARREPNGDMVGSLSSTRKAAASSQSAACLAEPGLSAVSLPPAIVGDGFATAEESLLVRVRPQSEGACHSDFKPYRDIVATQVYTIPSREGVPVRLSNPVRPSTGQQQLRHRARVVVGVKSARFTTHPSRGQSRIRRPTKSPAGRHQHLGVRAAASVSQATQQQLLIVDDPSATINSSSIAGQLSGTSSSHPNPNNNGRRCRIGGVRSHVENDNRGHHHHHHHPQAPRTAPRSARQRRHPKPFAAAAQAGNATKSWKAEDPRPPLKPRPMSAPARGRAIRRAVDKCCHNLPATSELSSYGAARFLRQWDGASRRQRGQILKALADQLLVGGQDQGGDSYDEHQPRLLGGQGGGSYDERQPRLLVDVQRNESAEGKKELPSGQQVQLETLDTSHVEFNSHPAVCALGASDTAFNVFGSISAENVRPRHCYEYCCRDQAGATAQLAGATGTADCCADGTGFLELLGAHAGLLATRISSYLRTLHSCGHAIGLCLRVTTLLAESTFETARGRDRYTGCGCGCGCGSGGGSDSISTSLAQQLSTPGIIRVALETVAGKPVPKPVAIPVAKPVAKPEAKPASKPIMTRRESARKTWPSPREEEESNRTQALRLLLALVRAGGRQIKEHLTCSASTQGVGKSDDALGPILVALRQPDCRLDTRVAAGRLLVELGVGNPAGSGRVWNAVLCILGQDGGREAKILGCDVARELLSTLGACCGSSSDIGCNSQSEFMWSQEHRLRPEVLLVPSVLTLSMTAGCPATREAAGKLAACLANVSGRCCYLLVAGLVGLLGTISGVKRSAPLYWRRRHRPSRLEATTTNKSRSEDEVEVRWSELYQKQNHQRALVAEITGRGSNAYYALNEQGCFCRVNPAIQGGGTKVSQLCDIENVPGDDNDFFAGGGSAGSDRSAARREVDTFLDGKPARSAAGSTDGDDHVIRAMEILRQICSGRSATADVCLALLSTLAPLAVFDLIVSPGAIAESPSGPAGKNENTVAADVAGESTFITQARTATDGCASFASEEDEIQTQAVISRRGTSINCDRQHNGVIPHPHRGVEGEVIDGGHSSPNRSSKTGPRQAYFLAVAEALLAMYRRGGGCFFSTKTADHITASTTENAHGNGSPTPLSSFLDNTDDFTSGGESQRSQRSQRSALSSEVLELKRMIDAALDGCQTLSSCLRNGDTTALARIFSADDYRHHHSDREEISILRRNVLALTKRLGGVRPPPADDDNKSGIPPQGDLSLGACGDDDGGGRSRI